MKWIITLTVVVFLAGCAVTADRAKERARTTIEARVPHKNVVEFRNLQVYPGGVVCGELSIWDDMQGSTGYRRFIVLGEVELKSPSEDDWSIYCSDDSAAALQARLGIGPLQQQRENWQRMREDFAEIQLALEQYRADNYYMPNSAQGLAALTSPSRIPPPPLRFREGGYLAELPVDPWGRSYRYERSQWAGVAQSFTIYTLGADGIEGGQGENADIGTQHIKYLDHIEN